VRAASTGQHSRHPLITACVGIELHHPLAGTKGANFQTAPEDPVASPNVMQQPQDPLKVFVGWGEQDEDDEEGPVRMVNLRGKTDVVRTQVLLRKWKTMVARN
jgi:hypothetical protein